MLARRVEVQDIMYGPALEDACFFVAAMARGAVLFSGSEAGSSVRWRLVGRGLEGCAVLVAALFSHGSVLAMIAVGRVASDTRFKSH